jgi:hypothetical protein
MRLWKTQGEPSRVSDRVEKPSRVSARVEKPSRIGDRVLFGNFR